jgi:hypothetical protein
MFLLGGSKKIESLINFAQQAHYAIENGAIGRTLSEINFSLEVIKWI